MADVDVSDEAIAVLVEVARSAGRDLNAGQRRELDQLISDGLVAPSKTEAGASNYKVTPKGQSLLDQRGVGANEA